MIEALQHVSCLLIFASETMRICWQLPNEYRKIVIIKSNNDAESITLIFTCDLTIDDKNKQRLEPL